jgi:polar amino acid transport system substrate-binding protein
MLESTLLAAFAPYGKLRASINVGNPILAVRDPQHAQGVRGVSVDLATKLAAALGLELQLVVFDNAAKCVEALVDDDVDIGFFAIDPLRGAGVSFTAPYVLIEGAYLVRNDAPLHHNEAVDVAGNRVVVGAGSAYDLFLTRALKHATIVRAPSSPDVVPMFIENRYEVAAGVKQQIEADALRIGGLRLLPDRFMLIQQAMGISKVRDGIAYRYLCEFIETMKRENFIANALATHQIQGISVAPASDVG